MKYLSIFVLALFLVACSSEPKQSETESLEQFMPEEETVDLTEYEYVCNHCKIGSHEAGTCPCGMEYEQNASFVTEEHEAH